MNNTQSLQTYWHCLSEEGNLFVTNLVEKHKEHLSSESLPTAKNALASFMKEFVSYSLSEEGQDAEVSGTETRNEVYDFLHGALSSHGIDYDEINDIFWNESQEAYKLNNA